MPTSFGFQTSFGGGGAGALCEQDACRKRIVEVRVRVYRYNVCAGSILLHAKLWAEGMQAPSVTRMCNKHIKCVFLSLTGSDRLWCGGRPAQQDVWNLKMSSAPETVAVRDTSDRQLLIFLACSLSITLSFSLVLAGSMSAHTNSHGQARLDLMD